MRTARSGGWETYAGGLKRVGKKQRPKEEGPNSPFSSPREWEAPSNYQAKLSTLLVPSESFPQQHLFFLLKCFILSSLRLTPCPWLGSAWISLSPVVTKALLSVTEQLGGGCYNKLPQSRVAGGGSFCPEPRRVLNHSPAELSGKGKALGTSSRGSCSYRSSHHLHCCREPWGQRHDHVIYSTPFLQPWC